MSKNNKVEYGHVAHLADMCLYTENEDFREFISESIRRDILDGFMSVCSEKEIIFSLLPEEITEEPRTMQFKITRTLRMEELVRCRDCVHYWKNRGVDLSNPLHMAPSRVCYTSPTDDGFCSEGERKDDE